MTTSSCSVATRCLARSYIARMADTFGVEISLRTLFDGPTVRELSAARSKAPSSRRLETMSDEEVQQLLV